jgi:hypothetical protein
MDLDGFAVQARQFGGQDEGSGGFVEVDRWRPPGRIGAYELTELLVQCEQIPYGIPPRESHAAW